MPQARPAGRVQQLLWEAMLPEIAAAPAREVAKELIYLLLPEDDAHLRRRRIGQIIIRARPQGLGGAV